MHIKGMVSAAAIMAAAFAASNATAATMATATTDLNIRSGPGPQYQVVGAIRNNDQASILGCLEDSQWCKVSYNGKQGWAYSRYLTAQHSGSPVVIAEQRAAVGVPTVAYDSSGTAATATTGAVGGAVAGALIGGPIGAVVGGAIGASAGAAVNPPQQVNTYVTSNPIDPVYLDGEVVVGATLPPTVELRPVPDYQYRYVYVNRQPVLVDPGSRRIVHIYR